MNRHGRFLVLLGVALAVGCSKTDTLPSDVADAAQPKDDAAPAIDPCEPLPILSGEAARCEVELRYKPPHPVQTVAVAGEWNDFSATAQPLDGPLADGTYRVLLRLLPGIFAYKLVLDGKEWLLDAGNSYRKYQGGVENSGLRVADCQRPSLRVVPGTLRTTRPRAGQGEFHARLELVPASGRAPRLCHIQSTLRRPDSHKSTGAALPALPDAALSLLQNGNALEVHLFDLPDGKYTIGLAVEAFGQKSEPLLLPFWIESEPFVFKDTPLYMAVTDRFFDGDPSNNRPLSGIPPAANYQGGDLLGVLRKVESGYFDQLGVRALWLTPFYTQPSNHFLDQSGTYPVAPYHGYWPVRARQVDPRLGGDEALHSLVEAAHRHGIRVLLDAVINHVHQLHEYYEDPARRSWFRTGCICGLPGCDFTEKRLECLFAPYLPDINWTVSAASEQFIADTLYWLEEFDLDGLRLDAVKHVEDLAIMNLSTRVRERFEQAGTHSYLLGETAMGWNAGTVQDNRENYDTIKRYIGPHALDGQFDFVWYHGIAYRVYAYDEQRFLHADYWTQASLHEFKDALMVNYLGSHDTSRFITLSTYRDLSGPFRRDIAYHKWQDLPQAPANSEPYDRLWLGMLSIMTLPGMPLLYYGDEYGEFGGGDPDNRHKMRFDAELNMLESTALSRMQRLFMARAGSRGLRRGPFLSVLLDENVYAYARLDPAGDPRQGALIVLNRLPTSEVALVPLPPELGFAAGARLHDLLGGPGYTVSGILLSVVIPPRSGVILALD